MHVDSFSVLHSYLGYGDPEPELLKELLRSGATRVLNTKVGARFTEGVGVSLSYGLFDDIPVEYMNGATCVHFLANRMRPAQSKYDSINKTLADFGADINSTNSALQTPLHLACSMYSFDIAIALLDAGADPTLKDAAGNLPLDLKRLEVSDHFEFWHTAQEREIFLETYRRHLIEKT
jgi:ankyrin repeat protein